MAKYHIKDNDEPGICRAKDSSTCPLKRSGDENPHFKSKEDAYVYIQARAERNNHGFETKRKTVDQNKKDSKVETVKDVITLLSMESGSDLDDEYYAREAFGREGFDLKYYVEHVDSAASAVVEKDGRFYKVKLEDDWSGKRGGRPISDVTPVYEKRAKVEKGRVIQNITTESKDARVKDEDIYNTLNDYISLKNKNIEEQDSVKYTIDDDIPDVRNGDRSVNLSSYVTTDDVFEREDGSKIVVEELSAPRDVNVLEAPKRMNLRELANLEENDERQNSRQYEHAVSIYDTRTGKGAIFVIPDSSEGGGRDTFVINEKKKEIGTDSFRRVEKAVKKQYARELKASDPEIWRKLYGKSSSYSSLEWEGYLSERDGKQRIVLFEGTGETKEETYYTDSE